MLIAADTRRPSNNVTRIHLPILLAIIQQFFRGAPGDRPDER